MLAAAVTIMVSAAPAGAGPECKCRANGQRYSQGQILCIRGRLARCEMFLNNPSWKPLADVCPVASLPSKPALPHSSRRS
jgi:hypothetical protein